VGLRETFKIVIDVTTDGAQKSLKQLRRDVIEADGAFGKMKVASAGALDYLQANAAAVALAAGTALVTFGAKAVRAFEDTALAAGKFADATGLAVDDASRWIEVAGDLGIETGAVETALGRMNKTLGSSPALFEKLGVEVARTDAGATDVNATFLNVVDRLNGIADPAEKARVASLLLGKGWQSMAELIRQGSSRLKASLADVSEAQVIDENELAKAENFRDQMDSLRDRLTSVALTIGEAIVPAITDLAAVAEKASDAVGVLNTTLVEDGEESISLLSGWGDILGFVEKKWDNVFGDDAPEQVEAVTTVIEAGTDAAEDMARIYGERLPKDMSKTEAAARGLWEQYDRVKDIQDELYGVERNAIERQRDYQEALRDMAEVVGDSSASLDRQVDAAVRVSEQYATLEGASLNSRDGTLRQIEALDYLAKSMEPGSALRREIDGYIAALRKIPTSVDTKVYLTGVQAPDGRNRPGSSGPGTVAGASARSEKPGIAMSSGLPPVTPADEQTASAMYQTGDLSSSAYRTYLEGQLGAYEKHSREWMSVWRDLQGVKDDERRNDEAAAEAKKKQQDAALDAERDRVDAAFDAAQAQQALTEATTAADQAWSEWMANLTSDPGNWAGRQGELNQRFADSLLRRADAKANAQGIEDGTVEWARFVRGELEQDKRNAPILAAAIDTLLQGIPVLHTGGTFRARSGEGLALLRDRETVRTPEQEQRLQQRLNRPAEQPLTIHLHGSTVTAADVAREIAWSRLAG
jgi:hypothetical protein